MKPERVLEIADALLDRRGGSRMDDTQDLLDYSLAFAAASEAALLEGKVLVPVEPTIEMVMAGRKRIMHDMLGPHMGPSAEWCYKAMIQAAPKGGE